MNRYRVVVSGKLLVVDCIVAVEVDRRARRWLPKWWRVWVVGCTETILLHPKHVPEVKSFLPESLPERHSILHRVGRRSAARGVAGGEGFRKVQGTSRQVDTHPCRKIGEVNPASDV